MLEFDEVRGVGQAKADMVSNEDDGPAAHEGALNALTVNVLSGVGVHGCEAVIEEEVLCTGVDGAGESDTLFLVWIGGCEQDSVQ